MLTGMARNLLGEKHDLWDVNTERSYYESSQQSRREICPRSNRQVGLLHCPVIHLFTNLMLVSDYYSTFMKKTKLSVIIASYNSRITIEKCLRS